MNNDLHGAQIAEQARELFWRRDAGYAQVFKMRGLKVWIYNQIPFWQQTADEIRIVEDSSPYATLTAIINSVIDGSIEVPVNVWELLGQDLEHDAWLHPKSNRITDTDYGKILRAIEEIKDRKPVSVYPSGPEANSMLALLKKAGNVAFVQSQFVLRKTQTVTSTFQFDMSMAGLDQIWTTARLVAAEPLMNSNILRAVNNIPNQQVMYRVDTGPESGNLVVDGNWLWGWLKKSPTITQEANNRIKLTQEFWLENWSTYLYSVY